MVGAGADVGVGSEPQASASSISRARGQEEMDSRFRRNDGNGGNDGVGNDGFKGRTHHQ